MRKHTSQWLAAAAIPLLLGMAGGDPVQARSTSNFGPAVDNFCLAENGQTPYEDQGCALCHSSSLSQEVLPEWDWWRSGDYFNFCPEVVNNPPDSRIDAPVTNQIISAGDSVLFQGSGSDPDGDAGLRYKWDFAGAAPASSAQSPGEIVFAAAGTYTISLTVSDSHGLADPTPARRSITVLAVQVCTDADGDGFSLEGESCGARDCDDQDGAVNPDAPEQCDDGIDNNCNGLVDGNDPQARDCPVTQACEDRDGDGFSPSGGFCGPLDCDDLDGARNPGQEEICGDGQDNDCDGQFDLADAECNGGDCLGAQFGAAHELEIERASWWSRRNQLAIRGRAEPPGESISIRNAYSLELIATTPVRRNGRWAYRERHPATVPCAVTVEYGRASETLEIQGAPADCDAGSSDPAFDPVITEARWHDDEELRVSGREAPPRAILELFDGASGARLGAIRVRDNGRFRFQEELRRAPCSVLVRYEDTDFGPYPVRDAPCDEESDEDEDRDDDRDRDDDWDRDDDRDDD